MAGFSGFRFAQLALFAITGNFAKTNRSACRSKTRAGVILKILILTRRMPARPTTIMNFQEVTQERWGDAEGKRRRATRFRLDKGWGNGEDSRPDTAVDKPQ